MNNDIEWKMVNLAKNCTIKARIGWQGLRSDEYRKTGDYLLVTGTDFENGFINFNTCFYVDEWRYSQDKNIQLKNDDVLITKDGTIGKIAFIKGLEMPATLNSGVFVIRPKEGTGINPEYLSLVFKSSIFTDFLDKITAGSTIVHLYQKDIVKFNFPLPYKNGTPDLETQSIIAQKLSDMDSLISAKEKLLAKKRNLKTAAMQKLIKDEESENWRKVKLGQSCKIGDGLHGTPSDNEYGNYAFFINGNNLLNGIISINDETELVSESFYNKKRITFSDKTVFLSINGTIGNVALYSDEKIILGKSVAYFNIVKNLDTHFLYHFLQSDLAKKYFENLLTGSTIKNLGLTGLRELEIPIPFTSKGTPDLTEQKRIATILSDMDSEISSIEKEISKLQNLKTAMMQKMFCFTKEDE